MIHFVICPLQTGTPGAFSSLLSMNLICLLCPDAACLENEQSFEYHILQNKLTMHRGSEHTLKSMCFSADRVALPCYKVGNEIKQKLIPLLYFFALHFFSLVFRRRYRMFQATKFDNTQKRMKVEMRGIW